MEHQEAVRKGLQYLKESDKFLGNIIAYCINAYKADPSPKTLETIRKYVQDTSNSVSEHVLNIAHNLIKYLESETREIEQLTTQAEFVSHRTRVHQKYMSELFMSKFQTFPRPRPTIHILNQKIPEEQLPKYARQKRAWKRSPQIDFTILDRVGAGGGDDESAQPPTSPIISDMNTSAIFPSSRDLFGNGPPPLSSNISQYSVPVSSHSTAPPKLQFGVPPPVPQQPPRNDMSSPFGVPPSSAPPSFNAPPSSAPPSFNPPSFNPPPAFSPPDFASNINKPPPPFSAKGPPPPPSPNETPGGPPPPPR